MDLSFIINMHLYRKMKWYNSKGNHGFDNTLTDMKVGRIYVFFFTCLHSSSPSIGQLYQCIVIQGGGHNYGIYWEFRFCEPPFGSHLILWPLPIQTIWDVVAPSQHRNLWVHIFMCVQICIHAYLINLYTLTSGHTIIDYDFKYILYNWNIP